MANTTGHHDRGVQGRKQRIPWKSKHQGTKASKGREPGTGATVEIGGRLAKARGHDADNRTSVRKRYPHRDRTLRETTGQTRVKQGGDGDGGGTNQIQLDPKWQCLSIRGYAYMKICV